MKLMRKQGMWMGWILWLAMAGWSQANVPKIAIHKRTGEVMVDLVVTNHQGKIIKNLQPSQLQVLDDGHPQAISSFRMVAHSVHLTRSQLLRAGFSTALRPQPFNVTVMVFDAMSNAGRQLGKTAATHYIEKVMGPRDYVAVYDINNMLYALQGFTHNKAKLLRAVDEATSGTSRSFANLALRGTQLQAQAMQLQRQATLALQATGAGGRGTTGPSAGAIGAMVQSQMDAMMANMIQGAAAMRGEQGSWASLTALGSIVNGLSLLPGRKELLYFSQYLGANSNTSFVLRNLMRNANRANVSFYCIDTAGLSLNSSASNVAGALNYAAQVSRQQTSQGSMGAVSQAEATQSETMQNIKYAGRLNVMTELATATGGFLAAHTNALDPFINEIGQDMHEHYELTYNPAGGLNGKYHTILISVKGHPNWTVRARKGYYAIPRLASPEPSYAMPVFALLAKTPPPQQLPLQTGEFQFPVSAVTPTVDLMTTIPLSGMRPVAATPAQIQQNAQMKGRDVVHFVVLQVIRDSNGSVVQNFSQPYTFTPAAGQAKQFLMHNVIFERKTDLPAGDYSVQTAIYEPSDQAASVIKAPLHVPAGAANSVRLSSIVVVGGMVRMAAKPKIDDPLDYRNMRIYPNYNHVMIADAKKVMGFYFVAYVPKGAPPAQLTMTFSVNGTPLAAPTAPLPAPDAEGRIAYVANIPSAAFPPGTYGLQIKVQAGNQSATRSTNFVITAPGAAAGK